jgi:hypothetical protein
MRDYSAEEMQRFVEAIDSLMADTESAVYKYFMRYGPLLPGDAREAALIDAMMMLVEKYGDAVAWLTVDWLDLAYVPRAKDRPSMKMLHDAATEALATAAAPDRELMAEAIRKACRFVGTSKGARAAAGKQAAAYAAAEAKRRGYTLVDRTIALADADARQRGLSPLGLQVIWQPRGAHTCAFCTMLASNSWRVASRETLGEYRDHIHPNRHCTLIFKPADAAVGGITPQKYLDRLNSVVEVDADGEEYVTTSDGRRIPHYRADGKVSSGYWEEVTLALRRKDYAEPEEHARILAQQRAQYARTHPKEDKQDE